MATDLGGGGGGNVKILELELEDGLEFKVDFASIMVLPLVDV